MIGGKEFVGFVRIAKAKFVRVLSESNRVRMVCIWVESGGGIVRLLY